MSDLTASQRRVLANVKALGGEVNRYAGQRGLNLRSLDSMVERGLLERVEPCANCGPDIMYSQEWDTVQCLRPLTQPGGQRCYRRVRVVSDQERMHETTTNAYPSEVQNAQIIGYEGVDSREERSRHV